MREVTKQQHLPSLFCHQQTLWYIVKVLIDTKMSSSSTSSFGTPFLAGCAAFITKLSDLNKQDTYRYTMLAIYFSITFTTRLVLLVCLKIKSKTEPAYRYQVFLSAVEFFHSIVYSMARLARGYLSGLDLNPSSTGFVGQRWWLHCYACMYYDIHFANMLQMGAHLWVIVLTICLTCDRIFAVGKPIQYRKVSDSWRVHYGVLFGSFVVAFSFSFYTAFMYTVIPLSYIDKRDQPTYGKTPAGLYLYIPGESYFKWESIQLFVLVHTMTKSICVLLIIASNLVLLYVFAYRMKRKAALMAQANNEQQKNEAVKNVKTLYLLTAFHSLFTVLGMIAEFTSTLSNFIATRYNPFALVSILLTNSSCFAYVGTNLSDTFRQMGEMPTFFVLLAFSPGFRKIVVEGLKEIRDKFRKDRVQEIRNPNH